MRRAFVIVVCLLLLPLAIAHTQNSALSQEVREFVSVDAPVIALAHARVIDGTGAPAQTDQTIVISGGKIQAVGSSASVKIPEGAKVFDLTGKSVLPGLVLMHEHMFYPTGRLALYNEMGWSFPRLYLACGVTSLRTAGSVEPYTDLNLKRMIDAGRTPGPKMHVTGPYLDGVGSFATQFHVLKDADDARRMVNLWADEGATSFKAYMYITRAELGAAVEAAHKRGFKITGHLCAVGFREAAALGIDNLEHGIAVDTEFLPGKKPDVCPPQNETVTNLTKLDIASAPVREMIRDLVARKVAVTSTLAVFEAFLPDRPPLQQRVLDAMTLDARAVPRLAHARRGPPVAVARGLEERDGVRACVRARGRTPDGRYRPDRKRRRARRLRQPARGRASGRSGFYAARSRPHRDLERGGVPRRVRSNRHHRRRKAGRPTRRPRRPLGEHRRHREGRSGLQGRRRLRLGEAHRVCARLGRLALRSGGALYCRPSESELDFRHGHQGD